jgi:signal recognition particle GTPase
MRASNIAANNSQNNSVLSQRSNEGPGHSGRGPQSNARSMVSPNLKESYANVNNRISNSSAMPSPSPNRNKSKLNSSSHFPEDQSRISKKSMDLKGVMNAEEDEKEENKRILSKYIKKDLDLFYIHKIIDELHAQAQNNEEYYFMQSEYKKLAGYMVKNHAK